MPKRLTRNLRIAIFDTRPNYAVNPTLVSMMNALVKRGSKVYLIAPPAGKFPELENKLINVCHPLPKKLRISSNLKWTITNTIEVIRSTFKFISTRRKLRRKNFNLFMAVNSTGLVRSYKYAKKCKVPFVYISFEIFFWDELNDPNDINEKRLESFISNKAKLIIIQDELRAKLLSQENRLNKAEFFFIPVAPSGRKLPLKSTFLRDKYQIPEDKTIVLHSGTFGNWTFGWELIENIRCWPKDFVLVIHTRYIPDKQHPYIHYIQKASLKNVILSTEPMLSSEYEKMVASADIGLALYKPIGPSKYTQNNIEYLSLSSGKFSTYMKHGLPVISIRQKQYSLLLNEYEYGFNLDAFNEFPLALKKIKDRHEYYSEEARSLFREKLDFDIYWPTLRDKLYKISKNN